MRYIILPGLMTAASTTLALAQSAGGPAGRDDPASSDIVVTVERRSGYAPPDTQVATKTDTPLEVPQSVQVITRHLLNDQNSFALQEPAM